MIAFVCNPFLAVLQWRLFKKIWGGEVDEVLINVNGRNDMIRKFIVDLWEKEEKAIYVDEVNLEIRQGPAFDNLYPKVNGKVLMTLDSDMIISQKGVIRKYSDKILRGECDAVGSVGYPAMPGSVAKLAIGKYGTVRLNPFMSYWRKEIVDKIPNLKFGTYNYKQGDEFYPLGKIPDSGWMDVMSKFTLQFLSISNKYFKIPLHIPGEFYHAAALSSLYRRDFRGLEDTNTQKFDKHFVRDFKIYYLAWYYIIYELTKELVPFPEHNEEYMKGLRMEMDKVNIKEKQVIELATQFKNIHFKHL